MYKTFSHYFYLFLFINRILKYVEEIAKERNLPEKKEILEKTILRS